MNQVDNLIKIVSYANQRQNRFLRLGLAAAEEEEAELEEKSTPPDMT
jgi:hypothetical protein